MADRDWEKELADIDRRLGSVPEEAPARVPTRAAPRAAPPAPAKGDAAPARRIGSPAAAPRGWRTQFALIARVLVAAGVVAALLYWPYPSRCGAQLGAYLALVGLLGLVGIWTSVSAWRHRAAFVHLLGLAALGGAVVLGAREILPKTGYAVPTVAHPAAWACS